MGRYIDPSLAVFEGLRVIEHPYIERGKAYVTSDRTVIIGTGLARGVPYTIEGIGVYGYDESRVGRWRRIQRVYVLTDTGKRAEVIDAETGEFWTMHDYYAEEADR